MKPFCEACERNREPILAILKQAFTDCRQVLEIGSGTGQHAVHFAAALSHLTWQTADLPVNHPGIQARLKEAKLSNVLPPLALDVNEFEWPEAAYDGVFSANTAHILSWREVQLLFRGIGLTLKSGGPFCLYGPFNYSGGYTSESNALFDASLKARDPLSGIRSFEAVDALAREQGLDLVEDHPMPAHNRALIWRKRST